MKIGILTYHRSHNYGAILQAIATRYYLKSLGHEVYYVDYFAEYHKEMYKLYPIKDIISATTLRNKVGLFLEFIRQIKYKRARANNFVQVIKNFIAPYCRPMTDCFDVVIYGSDQIWRKQNLINGFDPIFFANNNIPTKKHIAFSASMGVEQLNKDDYNLLRQFLLKFSAISVREESLLKIVHTLGFSQAKMTVDPTLLLTSAQWDDIVPPQNLGLSKYLLFYDLMSGSFDENAVRLFAEKKGLKVIKLVGRAEFAPTATIRTTDGPFQFIDLIRNADFVCTSSYHGLVFSIIYHKQFFCSFSRNALRASSLLGQISLSNRMLMACCKDFPLFEDVYYDEVQPKLDNMLVLSKSYLNSI